MKNALTRLTSKSVRPRARLASMLPHLAQLLFTFAVIWLACIAAAILFCEVMP